MHTSHPILGIDIGKDSLFVGFLPETPDAIPPKNWKSVVIVSYKDPRWWRALLDLIDEHAVVAAEPTGHHLLAPVAAVIHAYRPDAQLWQVDHRLTEHIRESQVAAAKNDRLDAISLTLIARAIAAGEPPRAVRPYDYHLESAVQRLRMLVNQRVRLVKESTRTKNRVNVLAHSLFPAFAGSSTWARAVEHGAVTPAEIKALAALEPPPDGYTDGRARRFLVALAIDLPDIDADPNVVAAIHDEQQRQRLTDEQIALVDAQIRVVIDHPPFRAVTQRWRSLPNNSDPYLAALHVATQGRATELTRDEFAAACGVSPRTSSSGGIDKTRLTRRGYTPVKTALHMWALSLLSPNAAETTIRTYFQSGKPLPACKNKLARILWGVASSPDGYRPPVGAAADEARESPPA